MEPAACITATATGFHVPGRAQPFMQLCSRIRGTHGSISVGTAIPRVKVIPTRAPAAIARARRIAISSYPRAIYVSINQTLLPEKRREGRSSMLTSSDRGARLSAVHRTELPRSGRPEVYP